MSSQILHDSLTGLFNQVLPLSIWRCVIQLDFQAGRPSRRCGSFLVSEGARGFSGIVAEFIVVWILEAYIHRIRMRQIEEVSSAVARASRAFDCVWRAVSLCRVQVGGRVSLTFERWRRLRSLLCLCFLCQPASGFVVMWPQGQVAELYCCCVDGRVDVRIWTLCIGRSIFLSEIVAMPEVSSVPQIQIYVDKLSIFSLLRSRSFTSVLLFQTWLELWY